MRATAIMEYSYIQSSKMDVDEHVDLVDNLGDMLG